MCVHVPVSIHAFMYLCVYLKMLYLHAFEEFKKISLHTHIYTHLYTHTHTHSHTHTHTHTHIYI